MFSFLENAVSFLRFSRTCLIICDQNESNEVNFFSCFPTEMTLAFQLQKKNNIRIWYTNGQGLSQPYRVQLRDGNSQSKFLEFF